MRQRFKRNTGKITTFPLPFVNGVHVRNLCKVCIDHRVFLDHGRFFTPPGSSTSSPLGLADQVLVVNSFVSVWGFLSKQDFNICRSYLIDTLLSRSKVSLSIVKSDDIMTYTEDTTLV